MSWRSVVWKGLRRTGLECVAIDRVGQGYRAESRLVGLDGELPLAADWRLDLTEDWESRRLEAAWGLGAERRRLVLGRDSSGVWSDDEGPRPDLAGCVDVDLGWTAFTNSLPIRRLALEIGESREIRAAWVREPALDVVAAHQRYTRIAERRFRYEGLGTGFVAEIEVDEDGLAIVYPGLFERLALRRG